MIYLQSTYNHLLFIYTYYTIFFIKCQGGFCPFDGATISPYGGFMYWRFAQNTCVVFLIFLLTNRSLSVIIELIPYFFQSRSKKRERLTRRSLSAEIARERTQTTRTSYPTLRYRGLSRKFRKT